MLAHLLGDGSLREATGDRDTRVLTRRTWQLSRRLLKHFGIAQRSGMTTPRRAMHDGCACLRLMR